MRLKNLIDGFCYRFFYLCISNESQTPPKIPSHFPCVCSGTARNWPDSCANHSEMTLGTGTLGLVKNFRSSLLIVATATDGHMEMVAICPMMCNTMGSRKRFCLHFILSFPCYCSSPTAQLMIGTSHSTGIKLRSNHQTQTKCAVETQSL